MKTCRFLCAWLMCIVLAQPFTSCKKDDPISLNVNPSSLSANAERTTVQLTIDSNTSWIISNLPSWIEAVPSSGSGSGTIQITVSENEDTDSRTASFEVSTNGGEISKVVNVSQTGKEAKLNVDITSIILPSTANASQVINITCNSEWQVSGVPDWIQISSVSGNGNSSIVITARSANESSTSRTATLVVSANDMTKTISVEQEAALSTCKAVPSNITSLYYAVIFDLSCSSDVALSKMCLISDYDYKHMTEQQVIAKVESEEAQIPEDETIYTRSVNTATKYHIISVAYDKKGNRGELVNVEFEAPKYLSATDDAWCIIDDAGLTSSQFLFSVVKRGRCATYDLIYGSNLPSNYLSGPLMAYEINYYRKNGKKNWLSDGWNLNIELDYPNDHIFSCQFNVNSYYGGVIAATWGIFSDGTHSSDITTASGDAFSDSVKSWIGGSKQTSEVEWIKKQKGWIKVTPKTFK